MTFTANSPLHLCTLLACLLAIAVFIGVGRRWRKRRPIAERRLRLVWIAVLVPFQVAAHGWWLLPGNFDRTVSLPIHMCDLVVWTAPFALWTGGRLWCSLLYFWGLALSPLAFLLPDLESGPALPEFWLFWIGHLQIVGSAAYLPAVLSYRPRWRDFKRVCAVTAVYVAVMFALNWHFDLDYGYVGPDPESPTALFGPWPWRALLVLALEIAGFALLWLPWRRTTLA